MKISTSNILIRFALMFGSALCLLILFSDFVHTGPDYHLYQLAYESANYCEGCNSEGQTILITKLFYAFTLMGFDFVTFLYLISLVALVIKLYVAGNIVNQGWVIAFILYITSVFWLQELIQLKLSLAFSVWLLGINIFFINKKFFTAFCLIFFSLLLHFSLIAMVVALVGFYIAKFFQNYKTILCVILFIAFYAIFINQLYIQDQILTYIINSESNRVFDYLYEIINSDNSNKANLFNIHALDVVLTCCIYIFIRKTLSINNKNIITCVDFFVFASFFAIIFKALFLNIPVVSFRLFELLVAPLFIVKTIIITTPSKLSIFLRAALFIVFILINCYVYIFKNPIFF
jgi:hypothetical protein